MNKKQNIWFKRVRGSYLPCSWQGWLLYFPFVLFLVATLYLSFKGGRSYAGQFYFIFPQYISALVVMHFIAKKYSK